MEDGAVSEAKPIGDIVGGIVADAATKAGGVAFLVSVLRTAVPDDVRRKQLILIWRSLSIIDDAQAEMLISVFMLEAA